MHHKRKKPKNQRSGCLYCKPHKHQANKDSFNTQTLQEKRSIEDYFIDELINNYKKFSITKSKTYNKFLEEYFND